VPGDRKSFKRMSSVYSHDKEQSGSYLCVTKIEVDGFGMSNVKDTIGLRRKTGADLKE